MTKQELIDKLTMRLNILKRDDVERSVNCILELMTETLEKKDRIEIRGFGSFSIHEMPARIGRNPKTGAVVQVIGKSLPHFKPGKELKERVNATL